MSPNRRPSRPSRSHSRRGCEACRHNKKKCNEGRPSCQNCIRRDIPCVYPDIVVIPYARSGSSDGPPLKRKYTKMKKEPNPGNTHPPAFRNKLSTLPTAVDLDSSLPPGQSLFTLPGPIIDMEMQLLTPSSQSASSSSTSPPQSLLPNSTVSPHLSSSANIPIPPTMPPSIISSMPTQPQPLIDDGPIIPAAPEVPGVSGIPSVPGLPMDPLSLGPIPHTNTLSDGLPSMLSQYSEFADKLTFTYFLGDVKQGESLKLHRKRSSASTDYSGQAGLNPLGARLDASTASIPASKEVIAVCDSSSQVHQSTTGISCVQSGIRVKRLEGENQWAFTNIAGGSSGIQQIINRDIMKTLFLALDPSDHADVSLEVDNFTYQDPICIDSIDLTIHPSSLEDVIYIETPVISVLGDAEPRFLNLPPFVTQEIAQTLFVYFVKSTHSTEFRRGFDIHWMNVCFPLVFSNATVFKTMLLLAIYIYRRNRLSSPQQAPQQASASLQYTLLAAVSQSERFVSALHDSILRGLKERLKYRTSVSCDHSLMVLKMLMSVELLKMDLQPSSTGPRALWTKLMKCLQAMISLRGGPSKLAETLTGKCLIQLLSYHFMASVGYLRHELPQSTMSSSDDDEGENEILDQMNTLELLGSSLDPDLDTGGGTFYDGLTYQIQLGFRHWLPILQFHAGICQAHQGMRRLRNQAGYELSQIQPGSSLHQELIQLFDKAETLKQRLGSYTFVGYPDFAQPVFEFCKYVCIDLQAYQLVNAYPARHPQVKQSVNKIMPLLRMVLNTASPATPVPTVGLLVLGIYQIGARARNEYYKCLRDMFTVTHKGLLIAISDFLRVVWQLDGDGKIYVDWLQLAYVEELCLPLYT